MTDGNTEVSTEICLCWEISVETKIRGHDLIKSARGGGDRGRCYAMLDGDFFEKNRKKDRQAKFRRTEMRKNKHNLPSLPVRESVTQKDGAGEN